MANTVLIKRSGTSSVVPLALESGEIAINYADGKLFYKNSSNSIIGSKLISNIVGTENQVLISESSGTFTISLPSSVYVSSLFVDNIEIDTSGATVNYALVYNGTKFAPAQVSGGAGGSSYFTTVGNGSVDNFVITHGMNTRDVIVVIRQAESPYDVINAYWEATTVNTVTIDFGYAPALNSVRVNIFSNTASENVSIALNGLTDVDTETATPNSGQFLKYDGTKWVPDSIPTINTLDDVGDVIITSATPDQFLKWNGSGWVNATIPTINTLNDVGDVTITTASNGDILEWNGSSWVNAKSLRDAQIRFYMEVI
jgi:hypothetical protein